MLTGLLSTAWFELVANVMGYSLGARRLMEKAEEFAHGGRGSIARSAAIVLAVVIPLQIIGVLLVRRMTHTPYSVDFTNYYGPAAESILAGRGPTLADGSILVHYPPGYSYYVAGLMAVGRATGLGLTGLIVGGNIVWNALTVLAIFLLAYRMAGRKLAIAAALVAGLYPPLLYLSKIAFVQVPYLTFLAWGLYTAYRGHRSKRLGYFALAGALLGLAGLLRPAAMALLAALLVYAMIFFKGRLLGRLARPAVMLAAFAAVIAPWSIYVYARQDQVIVLGDVAQSHLDGSAQAACVADDTRGIRGLKHLAELGRSPVGHGLELGRRALVSWYRTDSGRYQRATLLLNVPFAMLLLMGVVPSLRKHGWAAGLGLTAFVAAWGLSTLTIYLARYLATGMILAAPIMGVGALRVVRRLALTCQAWKAGYLLWPWGAVRRRRLAHLARS